MRRTVAGICSLLAIVAVVAYGFSASSAQDADMASHPLVGQWELTADVGDGDTSCLSQVAFSDSGSYIDADCDAFVVLGSWEPSGPNTATMSFTGGTAEEGFYKVRASVEVAADGQSFSGSFTFELLDSETGSGMGEYGPGTVTGTRLTVEAPGTPVGTILDLFEQFEGEATPAA